MKQRERMQLRTCLASTGTSAAEHTEACEACDGTGTVAIADHPRLDEPGMRQRIFGCARSREVWVNGRLLDPGESQALHNHSPTAFCWGYGGDGPAQLALSVALALTDRDTAEREHQTLKTRFLGKGRDNDLEMESDAIAQWLRRRRNPNGERAEGER